MQTQRRWTTPGWIGVLAAVLSVSAANAQTLKIEGRVLDAKGTPAAGVEVASFWDVDEKTGEQKPDGGAVTDAEGRFSIKEETYGRDPVLVAFDKARKNAALAVVARSAVGKPLEMRLTPTVRIHGKLESRELHRTPKWMNIYMYTADKKGRPIQRVTTSPEFSLVVPAGEYEMNVNGAEVLDVVKPLKLKAEHPVVDLGTIDLPAQSVALLKGKPMPPWKIADARGVRKDATIADFRGKWVLIDVWGYWNGPSIRQLGELIDFYDEHAAARDKFEIIAFHDGSVKSLAEMDARTAVNKRSVWRGRDLPFPVLVDASNGERGATVKELQIQALPTALLVDPQGNLVGEVELKDLEKKLPPLSLGDRVPQALERNVGIAFHPMSLNKALEFLSKMGGVPIKLDEGTLQSAGLHPDVMVPLTAAAGLSLRSWLGLMLDPLSLDVKPADDGLHVVKATAPREQSPHQREINKAIEEKLSKVASFTFEEAELENFLAGLEEQIGETFILDPIAVQAGRIDPHAKVSGKPRNVPIRKALETMLHPLGVKLVIRDEAVILTK
ncbi:redoxin domain-containing protein [Paludisphaera rhizosphaerae]|uniref:redoxin domain-containing protein n=1 Tax=Paludisphaera rhizosphaerae TaxID=2711216 RepID=UPI0013EBD8C8|nr:thioredoxin-like domain-containing protein [Paludisphaera rhizosphaerae]